MNKQLSSNLTAAFANQWNAELYDSKHSFVSELATDLVQLLAPKAGESILDLGCGTGILTQQIASHKAEVIGIDSAASMIERAFSNYPQLNFQVADARNLLFTQQFDAVFSNAVFHWIKEAEDCVAGIAKALKPGGRFVTEFGGKGNVELIVRAIYNAIEAAGYSVDIRLNPWYFPSIAEYATLLEKHDLQLTFATLFERPTPLEDGEKGMENWIKMFANSFLNGFTAEEQTSILAEIEKELRPILYHNDRWFADYRRIRLIAIKDSN